MGRVPPPARVSRRRRPARRRERQIARELAISQTHVSRLLTGALTKLRAELAEDEPPARTGDITPQAVVSPSVEAPTDPTSDSSRRGSASGYSGRFLVRMSGDLHEQLAQAAEREHVSLNRYVTGVLAASVASGQTPEDAGAKPSATQGRAPDPGTPPRTPARDPARVLRMALAANLLVVVIAGAVAVILLVLALEHGF